jgi:hypothetical protein
VLIPVLDTAGNQIAWIDHLKLEDGSLFREGERVFRLAEDGTLRQVRTGMIDPADLIKIADGE